MKVGITAEWAGADAGGPERYTMELLGALASVPHEHAITVYHCAAAPREWLASLPASWRLVQLAGSRKSAIPVSLPLELLRNPVDLCHATYFAPPIAPGRFVLSILDLGFESHPDHFPRAVRWRLSLLSRLGARRARQIVTLSEHAKREIVERYRVPAERVTVTPLAASARFSPEPRPDDAAIRARFGLPAEYLLYVGKIQERKNIPRLLRAYHALRAELPGAPPLALVGDRTWKSEATFEVLTELGLEPHVPMPGRASDEELAAIYRGATLFVYPSLLEGFGMPPLEAMQSGVPVACSNASSIPEVVGDAALCFDPLSVPDITATLRRALESPALRAEQVQRGLARARLFRWETTAQRVLEAWELAARR
ncbi:MAG: hypothetical protein DCC71_04070 [Proteobacteria bacterium]|nr:MAG: hypothetical protein DCC71_04070 [Pseudomonadota bacterium]